MKFVHGGAKLLLDPRGDRDPLVKTNIDVLKKHSTVAAIESPPHIVVEFRGKLVRPIFQLGKKRSIWFGDSHHRTNRST
jgi:hypothetical protein